MPTDLTQFVNAAAEEADAFLAAHNYPPMSEPQRMSFMVEMAARGPTLLAECEEQGLDAAGREFLALALTLDTLTAVMWGGKRAGHGAGVGLCAEAALRANELLTAGRYPAFTDAQREALIKGIAKRVTHLVHSENPIPECRADIMKYTATAVEVLMGPPPARALTLN